MAPMIERYVVPLSVLVPAVITCVIAGFGITGPLQFALGSLATAIAGYLSNIAEKKEVK